MNRDLIGRFAKIIMVFITITCISSCAVFAKSRATRGKVDSATLWEYKNGTLTFSKEKSRINHAKAKRSISDYKYWYNKAQSHVYKKGVNRIYNYNQDGDENLNLKKVSLSENIKNVPPKTFYNCKCISKVTMPSVEIVGAYAFCGAISCKDNNANVFLGNWLKYVGEGSFADCSFEDVSLPDSVTFIGKEAFSGNESLRSVVLSKKVEIIETGLFKGDSNLTNVDLPDSVTEIRDEAFNGTGITSLRIPCNVRVLGQYEYREGGKIPKGIFSDCRNLKELIVNSKCISRVYPGAMNGLDGVTIIVPQGTKDRYQDLFAEGGFNGRIEESSFNEEIKDRVRISIIDTSIKKECARKIELLNLVGDESITWKSSDSKIASVSGDAKAVITARKRGKCYIYANVDGVDFLCKVKVTTKDSNNDESSLKKLISTQRAYGATVSSNIHNKEQYQWKKGRLIGIKWTNKSVCGEINLNPFTRLKRFECTGSSLGSVDCDNYVTTVNANDNIHLEKLICRNCPLQNVRIDNARNLKCVNIDSTIVRTLDLSGLTKLVSFSCVRDRYLNELVLDNCKSLKYLNLGDDEVYDDPAAEGPTIELIDISDTDIDYDKDVLNGISGRKVYDDFQVYDEIRITDRRINVKDVPLYILNNMSNP